MPDDPTPSFSTQRLFGLDFLADATIPAVAERLLEEAGRHEPGWRCVVTPNVDHLVRYRRSASEAAVAGSAFLVLPDGMPIVWASRLLRRPLQRRLTGSDLFAHLWPRVASDEVPVVVVAPDDRVADGLGREHPGLRCVIPPVFDVGDRLTVDAIVDEIAGAVDAIGAQFVFVAISVAKTHGLAAALEKCSVGVNRPAPIVLLIGASPEFYLGLVRRAPAWMQRTGLEWFYRLAREPRRMIRRYLVDDLLFARMVWDEMRDRR